MNSKEKNSQSPESAAKENEKKKIKVESSNKEPQVKKSETPVSASTRVTDTIRTKEGAETRISPTVKGRLAKEKPVQNPPPKNKIKTVRKRHNSSAYAFALTVTYLVMVIAVSILISAFALDVANEAFALKTSGVDVTVTVKGEYITIDDLAEQLSEQHVIKHPTIFKLYARLRHKSDLPFLPATVTVTPKMGYDALLSLFLPKQEPRKEISISVPEGYTVDDIIRLFVSNGIGTREAFEYVINEYPLDTEAYWFLEGVDCSGGRLYRLEGYLYPDTYFFYDSYPDKEGDIPGTAGAKAVIFKMLNEFDKILRSLKIRNAEDFAERCQYLRDLYPNIPEMTLDDILTMASILEKEGLPAERSTIGAVFYNRLGNPEYESIDGRLESNVTVLYAIRHFERSVSPDFGEYELNYESPYNSYRYAGLPPGPVVSPTADSIIAALYPMDGCSYYYFVATNSGYSFFAETLAEHQQNVERAKNGEVADPFEDNEDWGDEDYNE